jgi:hypothetical protein
MTAKEPDDRFANATELLSAVTELRVSNAVVGIEEKKNKGRRKTEEKGTSKARVVVGRLALAAVLMLACGLVYLQRESVLPFVEPYTGAIVDERGVMVDQKDRAVGAALGWWESVAPYFAWRSVNDADAKKMRCRREGRPNCDAELEAPPSADALAGDASAKVR